MRAPKAMERPKDVDDLKRITGIGPKLEQVLNGFGIWTFEQIAALQVEEIAWLDDALGLNGRIEADNWLGQAGALGRAATRNKDVAAG
jgi:NADH-quinone oxidoreductase subunit E